MRIHIYELQVIVMNIEAYDAESLRKLVRFMTVLETVNVCKTVENVVMCLVRYGLIPEIRSFQMKNLVKM